MVSIYCRVNYWHNSSTTVLQQFYNSYATWVESNTLMPIRMWANKEDVILLNCGNVETVEATTMFSRHVIFFPYALPPLVLTILWLVVPSYKVVQVEQKTTSMLNIFILFKRTTNACLNKWIYICSEDIFSEDICSEDDIFESIKQTKINIKMNMLIF